jgi:hypothetical protein
MELAGADFRVVRPRAEVFFFDLDDFFVGERIGCPQNFSVAGFPLYGGRQLLTRVLVKPSTRSNGLVASRDDS